MASEGTRAFVPDAEVVWRPATVLSVKEGADGKRTFVLRHEPMGVHPEDPDYVAPDSEAEAMIIGRPPIELTDAELAKVNERNRTLPGGGG